MPTLRVAKPFAYWDAAAVDQRIVPAGEHAAERAGGDGDWRLVTADGARLRVPAEDVEVQRATGNCEVVEEG